MQSINTIVICGAGIAGVATAYYLLKANKKLDVILIDKNQPLSFTTSKSGENFRDFWPQEHMREFISDSIQLMTDLSESFGKDSFNMIYSGYNFVSHDSENLIFGPNAQKVPEHNLEEITDQILINNENPYLDNDIKKIVKIKNAGSIDVYTLGSLMLSEASKMGLRQLRGEIIGVKKIDSHYEILLDTNEIITAGKTVIATGPFINNIANMFGEHFAISNTLQRKFIIPDPKKVIPKNMPFTIYADSQYLHWSKEEAEFFASDEKYKWLLNEFPAGLHIKPEGEGIKLGWAFNTEQVQPSWETPSFDFFPQVVLKGASRFIPGLADYENQIPSPLIEYAGYYTRTKENWPLIGPTNAENVFVIGALAGYGTMAACAAGKLCSSFIMNKTELPNYAKYFSPTRYQDPEIVKKMNGIKSDGQL